MVGERKPKRLDPMAGMVTKLVAGRPWLGWRHRRPMEQYTAARKRNALLQAVVNGAFALQAVVAGNLVTVPMIGFFSYQMGRNYLRLSRDPSGHQAEWQQVRAALAQADAARAAGNGNRLPSAVSLAVLPLVGLATGLQFMVLPPHLSWGAVIVVGVTVSALLAAADIGLHLRHAPGTPARLATGAVAPVIDLTTPSTPAQPEPEVVFEEDEEFFPIFEYETLTVNQIMPLLPKLYYDELAEVADKEREGKARRTILQRLGQLEALLADAPDDVTAEEWTATRAASRAAAAKAGAS